MFYQPFKNFLKTGIIVSGISALLATAVLHGCSSGKKPVLPQETPQQVVEKFFSYLKSGGKRTLEEAQRLTNTEDSVVNSETFRRWTEMYDPNTEITVVESKVLEKPTEAGNTVAEVQLEFKVPSSFGGFMTSRSLMHLILDKKTNTWKIDFLAETINEESFMKEERDKG